MHQQHALGQQMQLQQQHSSSSMGGGGHALANRYNSNKTESTTTITTNIATTPASTASLHGDNKSEPHSDVDDDDDDDDDDEHGVESEPNCGGDVSGGESDHHRNYDTISLTPSGGSVHRRRHHGHGHGHSHNHGHGHSHYFHHHNRHRRTPSTSSLASNTLRRGTHNNSSSGSGKNCCDYLKVTVSDHQSPKIYVEKCCAGGVGTGSGSSDHNLDDEVERYFYVHQGTNHSSRKSSLAHGGGSSSQYGSHCSLSRSRCGSMRRRRSDHSITTTADVNANTSGSRTTTPLVHRNSNERLRHLQGTRTMSPMMLEFHNSYQTNGSGPGSLHRARASSSGSAGSCHARDDGDSAADYSEVRKAGVRIKCKHHSLEVSEDDIVLSLNEPGGGAESSCGAAVGSIESGRGSSTSLKHLLERDESGEIVILTPSKITIENYPMLVRVPKTAPTTPEHHRRRTGQREVIVSPLPMYATSPSPIHWHFPCSDSDGTGTSVGLGMSEDTTTSTSTDESHTVIQNCGKNDGGKGTKTVSIWRTSENSDEEASAMIFHHESGTVENFSGNSNRTLIRLEDPFVDNSLAGDRTRQREDKLEKEAGEKYFGPQLNNATGRSRSTPSEDTLKMSHNNSFPTISSVHDLSNEIRRFQKTSNFEPWTSNNLLSNIERNQNRRHRADHPDTISSIEMDVVPSTFSRGPWNNGRHTTDLPSYSPEDRFDLTSRLESFVRRFNKPTSIALTTLNRLSPTATGHLNTPGTGGRIRNRFGGIERRRRRRKHQRSQLATIRRLLGGSAAAADDEHPHLLQTELDWINEDLMRTQAEHREGNRSDDSEVSDGGRGLMTNIQKRVKRTINLFKRS